MARQWIAGHELELKPSTAASYRANIERYLKPAIGHERMQTLSPVRLSVVFRELYESGGKGGKPLSPRTVEFARSVLRRAMNDAVLGRVVNVNPVTGTKRPRVVKPKHTTWTAAQLHTFLEGSTSWLAALYTLSAATGMRRGEICALRWEDIDLDTGLVRVERSVTQVAQERTYGTPKNHERRQVTIDSRTLAVLKAHRKQQTGQRLAAHGWADDEGLVFTWQDGTPVAPDYVGKEFDRAQAGLGLPRLKLHELRHTHATILLRERVPVHVVAKRLGHKDPSITLNVYADAIPDDDGQAVDVFARVVHGA